MLSVCLYLPSAPDASVIGLDEEKPVEAVKAESVRQADALIYRPPSVANVTTEAPKAENDPVRPTSPVQPQRQAVMPSTPEVVRAEEKETAAPTAAEAVAPPEKTSTQDSGKLRRRPKRVQIGWQMRSPRASRSRSRRQPINFNPVTFFEKEGGERKRKFQGRIGSHGRQTGTDPPQFWHQCRGDRCHLWTDGYRYELQPEVGVASTVSPIWQTTSS